MLGPFTEWYFVQPLVDIFETGGRDAGFEGLHGVDVFIGLRSGTGEHGCPLGEEGVWSDAAVVAA